MKESENILIIGLTPQKRKEVLNKFKEIIPPDQVQNLENLLQEITKERVKLGLE